MRFDNSGRFVYWSVGSALGVETNELPVYEWINIKGTYDGNTLKIFQNGVLSEQDDYQFIFYGSSNELRIGSYLPYYSGSQGVTIDEVRISNIAR